jgi:hypothetical protein
MKHEIFGFIDPRTNRVFHVGCRKFTEASGLGYPRLNAPLPRAVGERCRELGYEQQIVILQTVEAAPKFAWVKWSLRFRENLLTDDWKSHTKPLSLLVNSNKLRRALGLEVPDNANLEEQFWTFHNANLEIIDAVVARLRELKDSGQSGFGINAVIEELRWEGEDTNRTSRYKIKASNCPFYARLAQMVDESLCGFVEMSESVADGMTLPDGRKWLDFAKDHAEVLRYVPDADVEDAEWAY